jgi:hypothetical protein
MSLAIFNDAGEIMRYQANYLKDVKSWAVIDTRTGEKLLSLNDKKEAATASAWFEEMHSEAA